MTLARGVIVLAVAWAAVWGTARAEERPIVIGVLAHRGAEVALRQWQPHADYLERKLPGHRFRILPMIYGDLTQAARDHRVDFVITNSGHYTEMELTGDVTRIATRVVAGPDGPLDRFGGVVIALAGRDDIASYADIAGKTLLVPDRSSLGGWQMHLYEAKALGLDLETLPRSIIQTENHEDVVLGVLAGKGEVGFVRADLIEQMAARGQIQPERLKVVAPRTEEGYPYRLSTRLYPEWPFARVQGTSEELARDVLIALLRMEPGSEAARAARLQGWVVPLSYKPVDDLFRTLRLGPYATLDFALRDVVGRYAGWLGGGALAAIVLLALAALHEAASRRRLQSEVDRRAKAEKRLRLLTAAVEHGPSSVVIADPDFNIVYANDTFCRLTGWTPAELEGRPVGILHSDAEPEAVERDIRETLAAGRTWVGDLCSARKDGSVLWETAVIAPVTDEAGRIVNHIAIKQDITLQRRYEDALNRAANYDADTGLPNRALARDRIDRHCGEGGGVAVLHVAVDNLTRVNDSLGKAAGDRVIAEMAHRLRSLCEPTDTIARIGGDEFLIVRPSPRGTTEIDTLANAVLASAYKPVAVDLVEVRVTVRVGVAQGPADGGSAIELEKAAYSAATRAREAGGNTIRHFQQSMDAEARWRMEAEYGLRLALSSHGLELHLQPYVDARTGLFAGAEGLLRWRRPGEGFVPPARFIPVAEASGLIREIDRWVIEAAAKAAVELRAELGQAFPVAVNISPVDLHDTAIVDYAAEVLARHGLPPDALEIEVTEGVFLADEESAGAALRAFHALGIPIAIDDFGTGYSSLGYLRRYPVSKLKIDRSFVTGVDGDSKLRGLASAIAAMAGHLGLTVTAEGVERAEEWDVLRQAGCEYIQGFLFARPMPLGDLKRLVKAPELAG
ncbi:MAG: EAL domain-containing protein [Pseudomonadota bacterium]